MGIYEKALNSQKRLANEPKIGSALEFVLWVEHIDPAQDEMSAVFQSLPETERQRMKNAVKHIKSLTEGRR